MIRNMNTDYIRIPEDKFVDVSKEAGMITEYYEFWTWCGCC